MDKESETTELEPKQKCKHCSNNTFFIRIYKDGIVRYFCSKCKTKTAFKWQEILKEKIDRQRQTIFHLRQKLIDIRNILDRDI